MSQAGTYSRSAGPFGPILELTPDNGNPVVPDGAGNIDVLGGNNTNGFANIQTDGNPYNEPPVVPLNTLKIRITDSIILPATDATGSMGVIALGSVGYVNDRVLHNYNNNFFVGYKAGNFTVGASLGNTGLGSSTLQNISTGSNNTAVGEQSLQLTTIGVRNTAVGTNSMAMLTTGQDNVAVGYQTLNASTTETKNTAIGSHALEVCNSSNNTAVGSTALASLTTGTESVAVGSQSSEDQTTGTRNTAVGFFSLANNISGSSNTALGRATLAGGTTIDSNTAVGIGSLEFLLTGRRNTCIGANSGQNYVGAESSNITINNAGSLGDANTMRLGVQGAADGQQNSCFIAGIVGNTVTNTQMVTINSATTQLGVRSIPLGVTSWSVIAVNQTAVINNGYFCNKAGTLALALPAVSAVGDIIEVSNINTALGIQFTQAAGQQIFIGNTSTTLGAAGTLTSIAVGDALKLVCRTANTIWQVTSLVGNWSPV